MRRAFIETLVELAAKDERIVLLTGDLGFMALEPFSQAFPERFFNAGVAEQNMVGMATGLAEAGFRPYVYSIVTFATLRPYEFIRNGPVMHNLPVRIVGVGGGMEYGHNGLTHYGLEDVAVMRAQPGMSVICPADHQQTCGAVRKTADISGPVYYRIGKDDKSVVPGLEGRFEPGEINKVRAGGDVLLIALGAMAKTACAAAELLAREGIESTVIVVPTIRPLRPEPLLDELRRFRSAIVAEAHYVDGGLGSLICELAAENAVSCKVVRAGVRSLPAGITGSEETMLELAGISAGQIAKIACASMGVRAAR